MARTKKDEPSSCLAAAIFIIAIALVAFPIAAAFGVLTQLPRYKRLRRQVTGSSSDFWLSEEEKASFVDSRNLRETARNQIREDKAVAESLGLDRNIDGKLDRRNPDGKRLRRRIEENRERLSLYENRLRNLAVRPQSSRTGFIKTYSFFHGSLFATIGWLIAAFFNRDLRLKRLLTPDAQIDSQLNAFLLLGGITLAVFLLVMVIARIWASQLSPMPPIVTMENMDQLESPGHNQGKKGIHGSVSILPVALIFSFTLLALKFDSLTHYPATVTRENGPSGIAPNDRTVSVDQTGAGDKKDPGPATDSPSASKGKEVIVSSDPPPPLKPPPTIPGLSVQGFKLALDLTSGGFTESMEEGGTKTKWKFQKTENGVVATIILTGAAPDQIQSVWATAAGHQTDIGPVAEQLFSSVASLGSTSESGMKSREWAVGNHRNTTSNRFGELNFEIRSTDTFRSLEIAPVN